MGVELDANGKLVVGGWAGSGSAPVLFNFALVRYNTDGSLDTTFGTGGKTITDFGDDYRANALTQQGNGKFILMGKYELITTRDCALARFLAPHSLDST